MSKELIQTGDKKLAGAAYEKDSRSGKQQDLLETLELSPDEAIRELQRVMQLDESELKKRLPKLFSEQGSVSLGQATVHGRVCYVIHPICENRFEPYRYYYIVLLDNGEVYDPSVRFNKTLRDCRRRAKGVLQQEDDNVPMTWSV
jgi:hypothetical protein